MKKFLKVILENKLQFFTVICFVVSISIIYLYKHIEVYNYVVLFACILFFLGLLLINFFDISISILFTIGFIQLLLTTVLIWGKNNYGFQTLILVSIILALLLIILMINIVKTSLNLMNLKEPKFILEKLLYKIRFLYPILAYIILELVVILIFAILYEGYNNYALLNSLDEGLYYTGTTNKIEGYDPFYFSCVTFFTIGYGDIVPVGNTIKFIAQIEMFIGSKILSMILPIVLTILFGILNHEKNLKQRVEKTEELVKESS